MTNLKIQRTCAAEVLAAAISETFPALELIRGGATDVGFFYEVAGDDFGDQGLTLIEEAMRRIVKEQRLIEMREMVRQSAVGWLEHQGKEVWAELVGRAHDPVVQKFEMGKFYDFCPGPYVDHTGEIGPFRLLAVHSAELELGGERRPLMRIVGALFSTEKEVKNFIRRRKAGRKLDHRKVGVAEGLFHLAPEYGSGEVFWTPKGTVLREELLKLWAEEHRRAGFQMVRLPPGVSLARLGAKKIPSYRELPIRYAQQQEIFEPLPGSEHLPGLGQALGGTVDRASTFCAPENVLDELISGLQFVAGVINILGLESRLTLFLPRKGAAFWETNLLKAFETLGLEAEVERGQTQPLVEWTLFDCVGRQWPGPRLGGRKSGLVFQGADSARHKAVELWHTLFGTLERMLALVIEHCGGCFPLWLAPEQVRVLPVTEEFLPYGEEVVSKLKARGIRASLDNRSEKLGGRVRFSQLEHVPYVAVVGEAEAKEGTVNVRSLSSNKTEAQSKKAQPMKAEPMKTVLIDSWSEELCKEIRQREWKKRVES